jgi:hypothetical protein
MHAGKTFSPLIINAALVPPKIRVHYEENNSMHSKRPKARRNGCLFLRVVSICRIQEKQKWLKVRKAFQKFTPIEGRRLFVNYLIVRTYKNQIIISGLTYPIFSNLWKALLNMSDLDIFLSLK